MLKISARAMPRTACAQSFKVAVLLSCYASRNGSQVTVSVNPTTAAKVACTCRYGCIPLYIYTITNIPH